MKSVVFILVITDVAVTECISIESDNDCRPYPFPARKRTSLPSAKNGMRTPLRPCQHSLPIFLANIRAGVKRHGLKIPETAGIPKRHLTVGHFTELLALTRDQLLRAHLHRSSRFCLCPRERPNANLSHPSVPLLFSRPRHQLEDRKVATFDPCRSTLCQSRLWKAQRSKMTYRCERRSHRVPA